MEHRIDLLLNKLSGDSAKEEDWNELLDAIRNDHSGQVIARLEQFTNRKAHLEAFDPETPEWDEVFKRAVAVDKTGQTNTGKLTRMRFFRLTAVAAVLVIAALSVLYFLLPENRRTTAPEKQIAVIKPGSEGAVLTLANGTQVVIDTATNGLIAEQNGSDILVDNGTMSYRPQEGKEGQEEFNTMTTPTGKQFQFSLPDGTMVWLNAASSIKYPTNFKGSTRTVMVIGEAYFDVAKNQHQPFIVSAGNNATIEVLGTSFNVNAYPNEENIKTTLINGLVKVTAKARNLPSGNAREAVLKPGQQAIVALSGNGVQAITVNNDVNTEKVTAWKKGLFNFEGSGLVEVMKELERWYNIEVVYEGAPPEMKFYGKIGKQLPLNDVLEVLDKSKVKFVIEGRKLIVKQ
ncbi:FecR family protein [Pseudoflavitalea rhizosphaerae]|uniref:FecR family protein n=1 Tax=Pseudoflavitalea rhizosphaerae TaxID=1884793 RepID=UPI000F8D6EBF|nr:FecR family protein [Pseudoflavitalea rhizosphaerae]